jgi:hypothetical protein
MVELNVVTGVVQIIVALHAEVVLLKFKIKN